MKKPKASCIKGIPNRSHPLIKSGKKWFEQKVDYELKSSDVLGSSSKRMEALETASNLFEKDVELYMLQQGTRKKKAEMTWIKTAIKSGTLADKIAALTLVIQDSPVHNISSLESMICMMKTKKKRECLMALDALKELFLSDLLIPEKKLVDFSENPLNEIESLCSGNIDMIHRQMLLWNFEERLKKCYHSFLIALEAMTYDTVEMNKQKAVSAMFELLSCNPEQEQFLLTKLVNKVGDPLHRVAAKASRCLCLLLQKHPVMSYIVVAEVEHLLYRSNVAVKAQYYAICFLNQIVFTSNQDSDLAAKLINIYFSFFKLCNKKGEVDSKMMSALLTGVNRAYPYATKDIEAINDQMDAMYKVVHTVNINISIQALMLLFQVMDSKNSLTDRYYSALYRKLQDPNLKICSRQAMLLNLLFKSLKKDSSEKRVKSFIKRLLQMCNYLSPPLVCGILFLISELWKNLPNLLNLSQGSLMSNGIEAQNVSFKVTCFYDDNASNFDGDEDDITAATSSWVHRSNLNSHSKKSSYDPKERNPLYACADLECIWELKMLSQHYHPSVCLFANSLLEKKKIEYEGDPLQDFTLIRFLDRFVFRNPKKLTIAKENESKHRFVFCKRLLRKLPTAKQIPVDSQDYVAQTEDNVTVDEKFMHKYFVQRARNRERLGLDDSDNDSVSSQQFQDYLESIEPGNRKDKEDIDFAAVFTSAKKNKQKASQDADHSDEDIEFDADELKGAFEEYDDLLEHGSDNEQESNEEDIDFGKTGIGIEKSENSKVERITVLSGEDEDFPSQETENAPLNDSDNDEDMPPQSKKKKSSKYDIAGMFASAEEFSSIMDENANSKLNMIGTETLANKDNADVKQLKWEMQRDRFVKGHDWKQKKRKNFKQKKSSQKQSFQKQRLGKRRK
ncbi:CCAAT/enhancer-binding protein zeta [Nymphon striatum]|nr:CCAAT/enhancer-binding protein zeta [Nymphon striatum]